MKTTPEMIAQMEAPITKYERSDSTEKRCVAAAFRLLIADLKEVQRELENERARGIHSCHDNCTRDGCVNRRLREELNTTRKQLEEATATRGNGVLVPAPKLEEMQAEILALRKQLAGAQAGEARALADMDQLCESGPSLSANEFELIRMTLETRPSGSAALDAAIADAIEPYRKDAERYRWLTNDHDSPDTRKACHDISARIPVMSYSAASQAIDTAIAAKGEKI